MNIHKKILDELDEMKIQIGQRLSRKDFDEFNEQINKKYEVIDELKKQKDMSKYVTKDELESVKNDVQRLFDFLNTNK